MRALVAGTLTLLIAAGCSGPAPSLESGAPSALPTPSIPIASPSAEPSASEAATPSPAPSFGALSPLPPGAAIRVAVVELNLRMEPSTSAKRVTILDRGDVLIVSPVDGRSFDWGPVKANGYSWYPVVVAAHAGSGKIDPLPAWPLDFGAAPIVSGWVATDDGTRPYVTQLAPRCPTKVDLVNVSAMLPAERLACFGAPFVLEGTYGCAGCGGASAGSFEPWWLASPLEFGFLSVNPREQFGPLAIRFAPDGPAEPPAGSIIRVTVHVNDPRSSTCRISLINDEGELAPLDASSTLFYCRERVVVDSYEILGTDPDFPLG